MRVFVSHSSRDKPKVEPLVEALKAEGFEPWFDQDQMDGGDHLVAEINQGLEESDAALIVFSKSTAKSHWVRAEVGYLIYAWIEHQKPLVPVIVDAEAAIPALIQPLLRCDIENHSCVVKALRRPTKTTTRSLGAAPRSDGGRLHVVDVKFQRSQGNGAFDVAVRFDGTLYSEQHFEGLPAAVVSGRSQFLDWHPAGTRRDQLAADRSIREQKLEGLGHALRDVCFPGLAATALAELVDGAAKTEMGTLVELRFQSSDAELLGLPFETLRLEDGRMLALETQVQLVRRPAGLKATDPPKLPGPLKVLVAVGAPDEDKTQNKVLDLERELQNILDAVEAAKATHEMQVRILEVGSPEQIAKAIETDTYHVLHLSCHGQPGELELETELGDALKVKAGDLLDPIRRQGKPLPMVFLNTCHGAVRSADTASLAEEFLRAGVPVVLAMQTSVSDHYATELARRVYEHLALDPRAARALAKSRLELEAERKKALGSGEADARATQPEAATATLFRAGDELPLLDPKLPKDKLKARTWSRVAGPVPQLGMDELIGRRKHLRATLAELRAGKRAGVMLTGIGGSGKSALAGRVMQFLDQSGWKLAAHKGKFNAAEIAAEIEKWVDLKAGPGASDAQRFSRAAEALAGNQILLVLDDFEQNLTLGGDAFLDSDTATFLRQLTQNARSGRLLLTCRYPVPGFDARLARVALDPLSDAESRKLALRLPSIQDQNPQQLRRILKVVAGHPRMFELLDALMQGGDGRLPEVTEKLSELLETKGMTLGALETPGTLDEGLREAASLMARDVLLRELVELARSEAIDEFLFQMAVSNLPVDAAGLARMMLDDPAADVEVDPGPAQQVIDRLADLSLVVRAEDGSGWVHRWTAEGLRELSDEESYRRRCNRAGRFRWWRVETESHDLADAIEAVRNHLAGKDFDTATFLTHRCFEALTRFRQSAGIAALAHEVLQLVPPDHGNYGSIADREIDAHIALGSGRRAFDRLEELASLYQGLLKNEPDSQTILRNLSVVYNKMGDLYRALGRGDDAQEAYQSSLDIRERLAKAEPERTDYQRDLSVSYSKMGDLYRALGRGADAQEAYQSSLDIAERLAKAEPERTDYQRDLSVSYNKMGDLYRALGRGDDAQEAYQSSLDIAERLAKAEPERTDYQRDLSVSYDRMGDLYRALGRGDAAQKAYQNSLDIRERLAKAEPDRTDYQRDLSVSYERTGDLYRALGRGEAAQEAYQSSLDIRQRLAKAEPGRTDYQQDLAVSYERTGDLYRALGRGEAAQEAYQSSLDIRQRLAKAEPGRTDYQQDLAVSCERFGDIHREGEEFESAINSFEAALAIRDELARLEPARADLQVELWVPLTRLAALVGPENGRPLVERAIAILEKLEAEGRLDPSQAPKLDLARQMLLALDSSDD